MRQRSSHMRHLKELEDFAPFLHLSAILQFLKDRGANSSKSLAQ